MKGLRKKITCVVVVPCILGLVLSQLSTIGYVYFTYPSLMNHYADKMIDHQKNSLLTQSKLLGKSSEFSYIQKTLNLVNIASDFMESYIFYGMIVNDALNVEKIFIDYNSGKSNPKFDNYSVWYFHNISNTSNLTEDIIESLNSSAYYSSLIYPVKNYFSLLNSSLFRRAYITYTNELYYSYPTIGSNITANCLADGKNNTCDSCNESVGVPYYNPVCRDYFLEVQKVSDNEAILISPYEFSDGSRGESACKGLWNFSTNLIILTYCIDFVIHSSFDKHVEDGSSYSFSLDKNQAVITYKNYDQKEINDNTIIELEFDQGNNSSSEIRSFKKKVVEPMINQVSKFTYYTRYGKKMMVAIAPVLMMMSSGGAPVHVASMAVVMKKQHVEKDFDKLKDSCNQSLLYQVILQSILCCFIGLLTVFMTDVLTASVIDPMDQLLKIMKRLKEGDLEIDIQASYQPSPPEISSLYDVFDKLRVVLRFSQIEKNKITDASFVYSQALVLFKSFQNEQAMEICYRELGYICYKKKMWQESGRYLHKALVLAVKLGCYDDYEIARIKTDTATAYVKTGDKRQEGLEIFKEAVQTFQSGNYYTDIVVAMIEIAESLAETQELNQEDLDFIEVNLEKSNPEERELLRQKLFYVKACFYKNCRMFKSAACSIRTILEDFSEFLPDIWVKAVDLLARILDEAQVDSSQIMEIKAQRKSCKKDVVVVLSDSLASGIVGSHVLIFLNEILEPFDKLALIQYSNSVQIAYNLSKIPGKNVKISKIFKKSQQKVVFDALHEGFKQFRLNRCSMIEDRNEWVILIRDSEDEGSVLTEEDIFREISDSKAGVIVINCFFNSNSFSKTSFKGRRINQFSIPSGDSCKIVFKEIEAFLCPYREVFL